MIRVINNTDYKQSVPSTIMSISHKSMASLSLKTSAGHVEVSKYNTVSSAIYVTAVDESNSYVLAGK